MARLLSEKKCIEVILKLEKMYPDAKAELNFNNPLELLIATILSAQCTDVRVNKTTPGLFEELKTPEDYLLIGEEELGNKIRSCGFYKTKSKHIIEACQILVERFDSKIPQTMEELMLLPGVGRKTANVVLSNAFDIPGIAVDTHVFRVSNRIGLAQADDVWNTEQQLMKRIPKERWSKSHHTLIFHGRRCCKARKPMCRSCALLEECTFESKTILGGSNEKN